MKTSMPDEPEPEPHVRLTACPHDPDLNRMGAGDSWYPFAPCRGRTDLYFPKDGDLSPEARALCRTCPFRAPCYDIGRAQTHGWFAEENVAPTTRRRMRETRAPEVQANRAKQEAKKARARELERAGWNNAEIGRELGVHRETVGRWLKQG